VGEFLPTIVSGFLLNVGLCALERTTFLPQTYRCRKALCSEYSRGETRALSNLQASVVVQG